MRLLHALVHLMARLTALVGGVVLSGLIILTTVSIIGRSISKAANSETIRNAAQTFTDWVNRTGIDEINGTYELTEAGVAFAIFSFLPICQFYGVHATVDVFTNALGRRANRVLRFFWEIILTAVIIFLTLRLEEGMQRYIRNGETTLFLQFPVWWAYAFCMVAAAIACLTAIYCVYARGAELARDQDILPQG